MGSSGFSKLRFLKSTRIEQQLFVHLLPDKGWNLNHVGKHEQELSHEQQLGKGKERSYKEYMNHRKVAYNISQLQQCASDSHELHMA